MSSKQNLPTTTTTTTTAAATTTTTTTTTTTQKPFTGVGQKLGTGSEKEESSQKNAKNSKVEVATQGEDRKLNTLKQSEKQKLQACLDKEGSHLKNWRHVVDRIFGNDEDNSKAKEIKATIENNRFGVGAARTEVARSYGWYSKYNM